MENYERVLELFFACFGRKGLLKLFCKREHRLFFHLANGAIVGEKSVGFVLYVGKLREHRGAKSFFFNGRNDLVLIQGNERRLECFLRGEKAIAIGLFKVKGVRLVLQGVAAKFREDQGPFGVGVELDLFEVDVLALHVAFFFCKPARGGVKDPGGILALAKCEDSVGVVLPPALVEDGVIDA